MLGQLTQRDADIHVLVQSIPAPPPEYSVLNKQVAMRVQTLSTKPSRYCTRYSRFCKIPAGKAFNLLTGS